MGGSEGPTPQTMVVKGGPYDGAQAMLRAAGRTGLRHLWLSEVDGDWHAYLLVPKPDRDDDFELSHLGRIEGLPTLDFC